MTRRFAAAGLALVALVIATMTGYRDIHGLTLVFRAADRHGIGRRLADFDTVRIRERVVEIRTPAGSMLARVYMPVDGSSQQTVLLVPGLHPASIDDPRLAWLARRLSEAGVTVVTPQIRELSRFEITSLVTDRIEAAAYWLAAESGLAPAGRIGLMGISFSGGLAVVAAGRPSLRNRLLYVFSFGGHDDLRQVLNYFCTGHQDVDGDDEARATPNDYGVAIVVLHVAARLVPEAQVEPLRAAVRRFLWASYFDRIDKLEAQREFAAAREMAHSLPEPASTLLRYVNEREVTRLGARLQPHLGFYVDQPALSPIRSPAPSAPVYLLHGRDDNVIPAAESRRLFHRLHDQVRVRLLVTDLISHADANQPAGVVNVLELARFWGDLLSQ